MTVIIIYIRFIVVIFIINLNIFRFNDFWQLFLLFFLSFRFYNFITAFIKKFRFKTFTFYRLIPDLIFWYHSEQRKHPIICLRYFNYYWYNNELGNTYHQKLENEYKNIVQIVGMQNIFISRGYVRSSMF